MPASPERASSKADSTTSSSPNTSSPHSPLSSSPAPAAKIKVQSVKRLCAKYAALRDLLAQQATAIEERDLGRICSVVNTKERIIAELRNLHVALAGSHGDSNGNISSNHRFVLEEWIAQSAPHSDEIAKLLKPLPEIIEEMLRLEERCIGLMKDFQLEARSELDQINRGHQTIQNYARARSEAAPRYLKRSW